jgi:hypothetical protein
MHKPTLAADANYTEQVPHFDERSVASSERLRSPLMSTVRRRRTAPSPPPDPRT